MKGLTTHVLDTMRGTGAAGLRVEVRSPLGEAAATTLDAQGRASLVQELMPGTYEILFHAGDYLGEANFYDIIPVRFRVENPLTHYHVPLILSAYGYSTYRGG
jgi:5-hydroxyisourate hydrolase